jgi:DisA bacterial checkpoint controller nucleotide-binding
MADLKHLHAELEKAQVPVEKYRAENQFLFEADYALRPHQHEGKTVPYGFISVTTLKYFSDCTRVSSNELTINEARAIADGKSIFVIIEANQYAGLLILSQPQETEYFLVSFQKKLGGVIGVTGSNGTTRFFSQKGIAIHELRNWRVKPNINSTTEIIRRSVPMIDCSNVSRILEFCFYSLSANKTGATLVWFLREPDNTVLIAAKSQIDTQALQINLLSSQNLLPLQSILERNDGAALIAPGGEVIGVGAHLQQSEKSTKLIEAYSGTRHTSARRFSYDWAEAVIFTVSSDGPVSVFSDGLKVTEMDIFNAEIIADHYRSITPENHVDHSSWDVICPQCGKNSIVHEIDISGWKDRETVNCPVCYTQIAARKCYQLTAQIVKKI